MTLPTSPTPNRSRRTMRRAAVAIAALGLSVGVAACGSDDPKTPTTPTLANPNASTPGGGSVTADTQVIVGDQSPGMGSQDQSGLPTP